MKKLIAIIILAIFLLSTMVLAAAKSTSPKREKSVKEVLSPAKESKLSKKPADVKDKSEVKETEKRALNPLAQSKKAMIPEKVAKKLEAVKAKRDAMKAKREAKKYSAKPEAPKLPEKPVESKAINEGPIGAGKRPEGSIGANK